MVQIHNGVWLLSSKGEACIPQSRSEQGNAPSQPHVDTIVRNHPELLMHATCRRDTLTSASFGRKTVPVAGVPGGMADPILTHLTSTSAVGVLGKV